MGWKVRTFWRLTGSSFRNSMPAAASVCPQAAELKADHARLAAEMATEIAEIKTEAMDEGVALTRMLLDEVASLRKGLALIGAKLDVDGGPSANGSQHGSQYGSQHGDGQNESGLLEAGPFWEQANLIEDSTGRPRLQVGPPGSPPGSLICVGPPSSQLCVGPCTRACRSWH